MCLDQWAVAKSAIMGKRNGSMNMIPAFFLAPYPTGALIPIDACLPASMNTQYGIVQYGSFPSLYVDAMYST